MSLIDELDIFLSGRPVESPLQSFSASPSSSPTRIGAESTARRGGNDTGTVEIPAETKTVTRTTVLGDGSGEVRTVTKLSTQLSVVQDDNALTTLTTSSIRDDTPSTVETISSSNSASLSVFKSSAIAPSSTR